MRKKGHGGKHTHPKKWSSARRPAGPATPALPIDHQWTSIDWLKPVMTAGLVNMHIDRSIANLDCYPRSSLIWVHNVSVYRN